MKRKRFFIETHGCQMNAYDSRVVCEMLRKCGYEETSDPRDADLVLINTCSVRERAERKALSRLNEFNALRKRGRRIHIGIIGCMAQRLGERLVEAPVQPDLIIGPDAYESLPQALEQLEREHLPFVNTHRDRSALYAYRPETYDGVTAFVTIMRGCNNYCSYCVVPYVRGPERSKPHGEIIDEIKHLVDLGVKEVTLLGQNVNSYNDGKVDFAGLLELVNDIDGLVRIRFTTSHPKDLSERVIERLRSLPKVCEHLHLPLQSGSDRILKLMNRNYTFSDYLALVERIREAIPDIALSTDILVGFPGETAEDHEATINAMKTVRFDSAFMFKYSPRKGTAASELADDVSEDEKIRRLNEVIRLQNAIIDEKKQGLLGKEVEILLEGRSERNPDHYLGRTRKNWLAIVPSKGVSKGEVIIARVVKATRWMLTCEAASGKVGAQS